MFPTAGKVAAAGLKKVENMTRILLYSDEPILAKGLESVLRQVDGFDLLPTCGSVASLVEQMAPGSPELVLMDLTPEVTFAVLTAQLRRCQSCLALLQDGDDLFLAVSRTFHCRSP